MSLAIHTEALSKRYQLGRRASYGSLRDTLARAVSGSDKDADERTREIWALRDVSIDVAHGESIGLIGRNGSGKSTLLKILSRITEPTSGRARVVGRVGSMLEVGTGFHPELTGRENVFVNGAILGMTRRDISRRFDEIVAFAGVERHTDTPVKHYSSGMQMRLAFAVAAHLEPTILLVDEVLAVGDIAFQKKCLGKLQDVGSHGRTVVFVSHQMNQLRRLCQKAIWLDGGRVVDTGDVHGVLSRYEAALMSPRAERDAESSAQAVQFLGWDFADGTAGHTLTMSGPCAVRFRLAVNRQIANGYHGIGLYDQDDRLLWGADAEGLTLAPGLHELTYTFEDLPVRPGPYRWHVALLEDHAVLDSFYCAPDLIVATPSTGHRRDECAGLMNLQFAFTSERVVDETVADAVEA